MELKRGNRERRGTRLYYPVWSNQISWALSTLIFYKTLKRNEKGKKAEIINKNNIVPN